MLDLGDRSASADVTASGRSAPWIALLALLALLGLVLGQPAWSQATCTWNQNGTSQWDNPSNWNDCQTGNGSPAGTPGPADHAIIGNLAPLADVDLGASPRTVDRLTLSAGRIFGNANIEVTTRLNWTGGTIDGAGGATLLILGSGSSSDIAGGLHILAKRDLQNLGSITWVAGNIVLNEDAEIDNQGVLMIDVLGAPRVGGQGLPPTNVFLSSDGSPLARIHNSSTPGARIQKEGAGDVQFAPNVTFDNGNDVIVNNGRLQVMGGGTDFGAYQVGATGRLEFGMQVGVTRDLTGTSAVSGSGTLHKFGPGTLNITGAYALTGPTEVVDGILFVDTPTDPLTLPSLRVRAPGVFNSPDNLVVSGLLNWEGGEITGTTSGLMLTLPAAATATITLDDGRPAAYLRSRDLLNQGSVVMAATATSVTHLWLDSASIDNQGSFTLHNNSAPNQNLRLDCVATDCGSFFNRSGASVVLNDQQGIVAIGSELLAFDNAGLVDLTQGCGAIGAPGTDTGTWRYAGGCTLWLNPRADTERVLQAAVILDPIAGSRLQLGGSVRVNGASRSFGNLIIDPSATLFGPAAITFTGITEWRGLIEGIGASETVTVASGAALVTSNNPADTPLLFGRLLFNDGDINVSEVRLQLDGNAEIRNNSLLNLLGSPGAAGAIGCASPPLCGLITNTSTGAIQSSAVFGGPATQLEADVTVVNQGALRVDNGVLIMESPYTAASGSVVEVFPGAGLRRTAGNLVLAAGTLRGSGVIDANVDADVVAIQPGGATTGNLAILGNFSASSNTQYQMDIAGTAPPAVPTLGDRSPTPQGLPSYDRLTISGTASLAGTLDVFDLGHSASPADVFDLMLYASFNGAVVGGLNPFSGAGLSLQTEATRVRLAAPGGGACTWNPGGAGADDWTNPAKWNNCTGGVGPGPGPIGTPGLSDTAIVNSGTVNLDVPVSVDRLQLTGGSVQGPSDLAVVTELIWTGGRFQGASGSLVTTSSSTLVSISGGQHTIDGRTLVLNSSATWTTGLIELANGGVLEIGPSGIFNSDPSLNFENIFASGVGTAEVRNGGAIVKLGPNFSGIGETVEYSGSGTITVSAGTLVVAAGSVSPLNATYAVDPGAALHFIGGAARNFGSSATLGGGGTLVFGDSSPTLGDNVIAGCITAGTNLAIRRARVAINCSAATSLATLLMIDDGAILEGSSDISVTTDLVWGHGMIRGGTAENFTLAAGATASFPAPLGAGVPRVLDGRHFINHGAIVWFGENPLAVNNGALFDNESDGGFTLDGGVGVRAVTSDQVATPLIVNRGVLNVLNDTRGDFDVDFNNIGLVNVAAGELRLRRTGTDTGTYDISATGLLAVDGADVTLAAASDVIGLGQVQVLNSAVLTVNGSFAPASLLIASGGIVAMDTAGAVNLAQLHIDSGTLTGNNEVRVTNSMLWEGGSVIGTGVTPGPLVIGSVATLTMDSPNRILDKRVLRIEGAAQWIGSSMRVPQNEAGRITIAAGGSLSILTIKTTAVFGCVAAPCTTEVEIAGSLAMVGDGADFQLSSPLLISGGSLLVDNASFQIAGVEMNAGSITVNATGTLTATPVVINGGVLRGDGQINGDVANVGGRVQPGASPGQLDIFGTYTQGAAGILDIEVGGLTPGVDADFVFASATASIDGTVNIIDAGHTLTTPETLDFLTGDSGLSGTFAVANIPYPGYSVTYSGFTATLTPAAGPLIVNAVSDAGDGICDVSECTLRDALIAANLSPDPDVIGFNIPAPQCTGPGGACVILPLALLPQITSPILIDGYSQSGATPNTQAPSLGLGTNAVLKIELDGSLVPEFCGDGLVINAPGQLVEIRGLAIQHFCGGIVTFGPGDASYRIVGNFIGLRADGSPAPQGNIVGISIQGGNVLVGDGVDPAGTNVVSGNVNTGISIQSIPTLAGLLVRGNLIGTSADGLSARPNGQHGIIASTASAIAGIFIGGNQPDHRNVISGNGQDGIRFDCTAPTGNCFDGTQVLGNFIGPAANAGPLGNAGNGVDLSAMNGGRVNIGGINAGEGNLIASNGGNGILATFAGLGRASFLRNEIFANGQMGIDLGGDGRTANDAGDPDTGANGLLNFPAFSSYSAPGGNSAVIDVVLDTPDIGGNYPARVDFYLALDDQPGVWLGTTTCAAPNVNCPASFAFPGGITVAPDDVVLGIVTDGFGKSSEASFYAATATIISDAPDPSPIGTPYTVTVEVSSSSPFAPVGVVDIDDGSLRGTSCPALLAATGPGVSSGNCVLSSLSPAGPRSLTASYAPTAFGLPFTDSSDSEAHTIDPAAPPLVNSTADPGDGTCDVSECTLREAIALANSTLAPGVDFDPVFFGVPRTIVLTAGELLPTQDLVINGPGAALLTVSGNSSSRVLNSSSINLSVTGATLTGGNSVGVSSSTGGAVYHFGGSLALVDVVISGSVCTPGGTGGAIASAFGTLSLLRTTVTGNICDNVGGVYVQDGSASIDDSTLSGNSGDSGDALRVNAAGSDSLLDLTNVTISGNTTVNSNAAIRSEAVTGLSATVNLTNCTVSGNSTSSSGGNGAIWQRPTGGSHVAVVHNSIIAGNLVGGVANDVEGTLDASSSFNVIGSGGGLVNGLNGNQVGVNDPLLAPLANYGGATATRALLPGSPAINNGSNGLATNADQRGVMRPQQGNVDVGAFESQGFVMTVVSGSPQSAPLNSAFALPLVVGVAANGAGEPVDGGQVLYAVPGAGASATITSPVVIAAGEASATATANGILGSYSVTATAAGATGTAGFALTNGVLATTTTITGISPSTTVVGQPYTVTVNVADGATPVTDGTVEVRQLSDGAICSFSLAATNSCNLVGNSAITTAVRATYQGASGYGPSQSAAVAHVVGRADTAIQIVSDTPDPSVVGAPITITVELGVVAPGAGVPTGDILITDGIASCGITLPNLSCQMIPKAVGEATLEARYLGDANFNASTDTEAHMFTADGADLAIIKRNGLRLIPGGIPSTYVLLVTNAGPQDVVNARVTDILPVQFSAASWTCSASAGASCPATGVGTVDALVSLASGSSVTFALTATAQISPEQVVSNRATVTPPANAPDPVPDNNESIDVDAIGIFGEGFETENE